MRRGFASHANRAEVASKLEVGAQPGAVYEGYAHLFSYCLLAFDLPLFLPSRGFRV